VRTAVVAALVLVVAATTGRAQTAGPPGSTYSSNEIVDAGHRFFGTLSRGLAQIVERAGSQFGLPNGYILGQEGGGAFIGGLRFGEGTPSTQNAGDPRGVWQGPTRGWGFVGGGAPPIVRGYAAPG